MAQQASGDQEAKDTARGPRSAVRGPGLPGDEAGQGTDAFDAVVGVEIAGSLDSAVRGDELEAAFGKLGVALTALACEAAVP